MLLLLWIFVFSFFVNNARDMGIKVLVSQSLEAKLNIRITLFGPGGS